MEHNLKEIKIVLQLMVFAILSTAAHAFSTSNIQYLYGNFNANSFFDTDGGKHTVTLENYTSNGYGDVFGLLEFSFADGRFTTLNKSSDIYLDLSPRISISKISGYDLSFLFVKDIYIAGEYNRQFHKFKDYEAWLHGVGSDLNIKGFDVFGLNYYKVERNLGADTYLLTAYYISNNIFNSDFTLNGFVNRTDEDLLTQNKLLYKLDYSLFSGDLYVGTEWHYYRLKDTDVKSNVLQAMIMVSW